VLAGGGSRRFGSPKALATFRGEALWARAERALSDLGLPVVVLANDPVVADAIGADVRADERPDRGPLAGIETGLIEARDRGLRGILVLACDLVLVESETIDRLVRAWPETGAVAFTAPGPWGVEPLCAIWGVDLLERVTEALDDGRGSPGELLLGVDHQRVEARREGRSEQGIGLFRSVNRPEDLADLAARARTP
jgi:molybdopterin-guanine dinucleotide biosynthesis protein A